MRTAAHRGMLYRFEPGGNASAMGHEGTAVRLVLGLLLAVVLTVGALLSEGGRRSADNVRKFQQVVGGFGLGAAVVPAWSFHAFDPRVEAICGSDDWPTPGGPCYSPDHIGPVSAFGAFRAPLEDRL
jgi:hypothetical protein